MNKMERRIRNIIKNSFDRSNLELLSNCGGDTIFTEILGYDSLQVLNFFAALEKEFHVQFQHEHLDRLNSIDDMITLIGELQENQAYSQAV